jgi:hypothetical protein
MRFYPDHAPVPSELRTDEVWLRMLRATDTPLDYDAVMASQAMLLIHSGGTWPIDGFSLADNLHDLEGHERDHHARTAFTYTVMNTDASQCLGCVYIKPLEHLLAWHQAPEAVQAQVGDDAAVVTFWVRQSRVADDLDRRLLRALLDWFPHAWAFQRVVHRADAAETRQLAILRDAGLTLWHSQPTRSGATMNLFSAP